MSYNRLHPTYVAFALNVSSDSLLASYYQALQILEKNVAMDLEYPALLHCGIGKLVSFPSNTNIMT